LCTLSSAIFPFSSSLARLRLRQDRLQLLLRMLSRVFQDGLYNSAFAFKIVAFSGENLSIEPVPSRHLRWVTARGTILLLAGRYK